MLERLEEIARSNGLKGLSLETAEMAEGKSGSTAGMASRS